MMPRDAQSLVDAVKHQGEPRRCPVPAFAALDLGTNNCRMLVAAPSGDGFRVIDSFSRIVRLGEGLHRTGQLSPDAMERAMAALHACAARLASFEAVHCIAREIREGGVQLLGTSGTVTTLAGVALKLSRYRRPLVDGTVLSVEAADAALANLRALGRDGLQAHPCVGPDRVDFVLPGCAVFAALIRLWPAARVVVADRGLREGMLLRMIRTDRTRGTGRGRGA